MRTHTFIFYSDNERRKNSFISQYEKQASRAANRYFLISLEGNVSIDKKSGIEDKYSVFTCFPELRYRLVSFPSTLSDVTVIVDTASVIDSSSGKMLRDLILEYPDVKFVFWRECNEKECNWKECVNRQLYLVDNLFPIDPDVYDYCLAVNESILNKAIDVIEDLYEKTDVKSRMEILRQDLENKEDSSDHLLFLATQWGEYKVNFPKKTFEDFILVIYTNIIKYLAKEAVCFDLLFFPREQSENPLIDLALGYDNLFDASNLRYACKQWRYTRLNVRRRNFKWQQESRKKHLAICVEEERGQNRFNSYCLFANGFRVLPVVSASELFYIHNGMLTPSLIVRDYDLQFPDPLKKEIIGMKSIDAIRSFTSEGVKVINSPYWKRFYELKTPIYFISKGNPGSIKIVPPQEFPLKNLDKNEELVLPGIVKPVNGIHKPYECIEEICNCFDEIFKKEKPLINTERMNHQHGVPLDIYEVVQSIIDRAKNYYKIEKYIHAAILSHEAMEIMNGFHQALMLDAYHLYAISENAISMNIVGVSEQELKQDTYKRVEKIALDIRWLLKDRKDNEGNEQSINVLNQIYSDCRNFCREKEHFESEAVFISAIGHLNEGFSFCAFKRYLIDLFKKHIYAE